jgi:hypothetical protein
MEKKPEKIRSSINTESNVLVEMSSKSGGLKKLDARWVMGGE